MSKYLPKAERMFQKKLKFQLAPTGYIHLMGEGLDYDALWDDTEADLEEYEILIPEWGSPYGNFNRDEVEQLFLQYGHYLELIEDDDDVSEQAEL